MALAAAASADWYVVSCACMFMSTCAMSASSTLERFCCMVVAFVVFWLWWIGRASKWLRLAPAGFGRSGVCVLQLPRSARSATVPAWIALEICVSVVKTDRCRPGRTPRSPLTFTCTCTPGAMLRSTGATCRRSCPTRRTRSCRRSCRRTAAGSRTGCWRGRRGPGGSGRSGSRSRRGRSDPIDAFAAWSTRLLTCWSWVTIEPSALSVVPSQPSASVMLLDSCVLRLSDARSWSDSPMSTGESDGLVSFLPDDAWFWRSAIWLRFACRLWIEFCDSVRSETRLVIARPPARRRASGAVTVPPCG